VSRFDDVTLAANVCGDLDLSHKNAFLVLGIFFVLWRRKADEMDPVDDWTTGRLDDVDGETKINDGCGRAWQRQ